MFINISAFPAFGPTMNPMMGAMGAQSTMSMMYLMQMMMQMMQMTMSMMMGHNPMSQQYPGFGQQQGPMNHGSPLNDFLGSCPNCRHGGGGGGGGQASPMNGTYLPPADGSVNGRTQNFINRALEKQGAPYVFGAHGNGKYDCSGLVHAALNEAGVKGQRLTARGYQSKYKDNMVRKEDLKPGDLVFFHSKNDRGIPEGRATHVEIYLGNGKTMGTDNPKEGARVEDINWKTFIGGARVPELANG